MNESTQPHCADSPSHLYRRLSFLDCPSDFGSLFISYSSLRPEVWLGRSAVIFPWLKASVDNANTML